MEKVLKSVKFDPNNTVAVTQPQYFGPEPEQVAAPIETRPTVPTAQEIATQAQQQAAAIIEDARKQAAAMIEQAKVQGRQQGYQEGKQIAQTELAEAITAAQALAQSATEGHNRFLQSHQKEVIELSLAIAQKLVTRQLTLNPESVTDTIAQVIEVAAIQGACRIRLSTQDYHILKPHWEAVAHLQQPNATWELISDQKITRGGFVIEVGAGTLDARLETKMEQIEAAFAKITQ